MLLDVVKVSERNVAGVAQQPSNTSTRMAVIHMEVPTLAARFGRATDQASPILGGEHLVIGSKRNAVDRSQFVVFRHSGISVSPFLRLLGSLIQIGQAPLFMLLARAFLAARHKAIKLAFVQVELINRFGLLAATTPLHALRGSLSRWAQIIDFLLRDSAGFAVMVEAIRLRPILVKLGTWLGLTTRFACFVHAESLSTL